MEYTTQDFSMIDYINVMADLEANHNESSPMPWELDVDPYVYLSSDNVKTFAMRDEDEIVGYCLCFIQEHHHYSKTVAYLDVVYVQPEYRGTGSIRFIKYIESSLKELNVEGILQGTTTQKDISSLLKRLGYKPVEVQYFKEI